MARTHGPPPETLARLERRLESLRSMLAQGRLSPAHYQDEIQRLTATDEQGGRWWLAGEAGAWHRWNGQSWVPGDPARVTARASKASGAKEVRRPRTTRRAGLLVGIGCAALTLLVAMGAGASLLWGYAEYRSLPKIVEGIQGGGETGTPAQLSTAQQQVRAKQGAPEAFLILFYEEPLADGTLGDVRLETWTYYTLGVEYTFINGDLEGEEAIETDLGDLAPLPYRPEQFSAYMSLDQVVAAADLDQFLLVPLEKQLVEGGEVYYADRLTFGLRDDELRYVESLALTLGD